MNAKREGEAEMTIQSRFDDVPPLLAWMESRLASADAELRERVLLAAMEAIHNVIRHGGTEGHGTIVARLTLPLEGTRLDLEDDASPLPIEALLAAELPDPDPEDASTWPEGGIGMAMIRSAADAVGYNKIGRINRLTLNFRPRDGGSAG
jgi:serine/threonine-protein kinase RsbW